MGKLIVFEGIDGSGKSTQFRRLCEAFREKGRDFRSIVFPRYDKESSALIRMYLGGEFGSRPEDVGAYAASTFYAVDRFASFRQDWGEYYNNGGLIITYRYTTSNAIHQSAKLPPEDRPAYLDWLYDFEYVKFGLPRPDIVFFCDVPAEVSVRQIKKRGLDTDIHEKDFEYLVRCAECASMAADKLGWVRIDCAPGGIMRTEDDIASEILAAALES
jgi:dTMP kinase